MPREALPAFLALSAVGMESQFFVAMKWLPAGFPGSVAWLDLALSAVSMESRFFVLMEWLRISHIARFGSIRRWHGITILCLDEMAARWFPRISRMACFGSIRRWHGITILRLDEMAAHWFPRISRIACFACLSGSIRRGHGITILRLDEILSGSVDLHSFCWRTVSIRKGVLHMIIWSSARIKKFISILGETRNFIRSVGGGIILFFIEGTRCNIKPI